MAANDATVERLARQEISVGGTRLGRWLQNHPRLLESAYQATHSLFYRFRPLISRLGYERADRWLKPGEKLSKQIIFDCRMCGQCVLHSTGMTCPMTCPKNLRNGPCGGVRLDGGCEVIPEMECIWVQAYERSLRMPTFGVEFMHLQPPVNGQLEGSSAWINMLSGQDVMAPVAWEQTGPMPIIRIEEVKAWTATLDQTAA